MILPDNIRVFGDISFRGKCPTERAEQVTAVNWCRAQYPKTWGRLLFHPKLDGKKTHRQVSAEKIEGVLSGVPDLVLPGLVTGLFEMKRRDHTLSTWQKGQREYLETAQDAGAFVGLCLGWEGFKEALNAWIRETSI